MSSSSAAKHAARLRWLRDKLLTDLEAGEKTVVYKASGTLQPADAERILAGLRRYSRAPLLLVERAPSPGLVARVESAADGLRRGYLSVVDPHLGRRDIPYGEWLALCRAARH